MNCLEIIEVKLRLTVTNLFFENLEDFMNNATNWIYIISYVITSLILIKISS